MDREDKLYIKDLTTRTKRGYLCVRVMRKWNYDGNIPGGPVTYIGLVLADEQANAIYAQIPESDVQRLGTALLLDEIYTIRKFSVRISRLSYVPFDAEFMIQLTSFTTVTPSKVPHALFPKIIYSVTAFKDIKTVGQAATRYIDVLGIVISEGPPKTACIRGRDQPSTLKEIVIKDVSGAELTVTLWEDRVEQFKLVDAASAEAIDSAVVLFCGCLPKKIFGKTQVNAGNACRWFVNPDIEEAQALYDSLKREPIVVCRPSPPQPDMQLAPKPKILEHKTLSEMNSLDPYSFPEDGCRCTVSITEFPPNQEWWYMGCEMCKKRLWNNAGHYYCSPCKCSNAIPLYKLQFLATDGTDDAKFFCYDAVARQLLRRTCDSLLRMVNDAQSLPQQMVNAIGREFLLTVGLTDQSFRSMESRVYLVDSCLPKPPTQSSTSSGVLAIQAAPRVFTQKQQTPSSKSTAAPISASSSAATQANVEEAAPVPKSQPHASETTPPAQTDAAATTITEVKKTVAPDLSSHRPAPAARKRLVYDSAELQEDDSSGTITEPKGTDAADHLASSDGQEGHNKVDARGSNKPGPRGQGGGIKSSKKI